MSVNVAVKKNNSSKKRKMILAGLIAVPLLLIVGLVFLREPLCESICSAERAKWERRRSEEVEKCRKSRGVWLCGMAPAVSSPPACDITCKDIARQQNYFPTYTMLYFGTVIEATLIVYLLEDKFRKKRDWGKAKRIMFYVLVPIIAAVAIYGVLWAVIRITHQGFEWIAKLFDDLIDNAVV